MSDKRGKVPGIFGAATILTASLSGLILLFLLVFTMPLVTSGHLGLFFKATWDPDARMFGIFPMMFGTFFISSLATVIATPLGIALAVFTEFMARGVLARFVGGLVEFMAGIPTVVYGFAGIFLMVPIIRQVFKYGSGFCVLGASVMLALVIIPTIALIVRDNLRAVPMPYVLATKSLGATEIETLIFLHLRHCRKGIIMAVILGAGRAIGDTMIALMLAGNAIRIPGSVLDSARTLTSHIALVSAADVNSVNFQAVFLCGLILFVFSAWNILLLNILKRVRK